jgi:hypothetical protein
MVFSCWGSQCKDVDWISLLIIRAKHEAQKVKMIAGEEKRDKTI